MSVKTARLLCAATKLNSSEGSVRWGTGVPVWDDVRGQTTRFPDLEIVVGRAAALVVVVVCGGAAEAGADDDAPNDWMQSLLMM